MRTTLETEIVTSALDMALARTRPAPGLVHHSDHGSQYTSFAFGRRLQEAGITPSMGSVGDCFDNAMAESFNATLECELLDRETFRTREEGADQSVRLHRDLLQPAAPAFRPGLRLTDGVRKEVPGDGQRAKRLTLHGNGATPICSPARVGISAGAMTAQSTPSEVKVRCSPYPVGPASWQTRTCCGSVQWRTSVRTASGVLAIWSVVRGAARRGERVRR